ncbi:MAG: alpha/beta fold hydrolase [Candidatus Melainabacteria bacterium]|nr:alpha/beta fold hydrolase [Candidatus Melainabacteria bacterium]
MRYKLLVLAMLVLISASPGAHAQFIKSTATEVLVEAQESAGPVSDPNLRFEYVEDGKYSKILHVPTYEWIPKGFKEKPRGIVLLVHGLTLYGKRYDLVAKAFAASNYYAVAADMHGFGRCYLDPDKKFAVNGKAKRRVNYEASYKELVELARMVRQDHFGAPLIAVGESLGATPCLRLAADHPEMVDALILSGPAVRVNPIMLLHPDSIVAGFMGLAIDPMFNVNLGFFMRKLVSSDPRICEEMSSDPLIRKKATIRDLMETDGYVMKSLHYARRIRPDIPILILQGSQDHCVVPKHVVKLLKSIKSDDQTLRWMDHLSHLLLETYYMKAETVEALATWIEAHEEDHDGEMKVVREELRMLGAKAI